MPLISVHGSHPNPGILDYHELFAHFASKLSQSIPMNFSTMANRASLFVFALCFLAGPAANAQVETKYILDLTDSKNHYFEVTVETESTGDTTELMLPVWTPGSYLVREYSRNLESIKATTTRGRSLGIKKSRKNRWVVETKGNKKFRVNYRVYANELSVRTNWVGREYAIVNGAPSFMTVPEYRDQKHTVRIVFPKGWSKSATSLTPSKDDAHTYTAENFDELVDSPIVAGNLHFYPFEVAGIPHVLVNVGEKGYWNGAQAASDLKKLVEAHHKMWQTIPYKRYFFLNVICEAGGGLEHDNSCLMMTSRWTFRQPGRYQSWLSLASHEFFHTWNVRRLRPQALYNYDYDNENYTPSLWIAEGVTSYYEDLLLARAKLISPSEFLGRFSSNIQSTQSRHGRKLQSLSQSSYDSWIKFYRPDENSSNTSISYYSKGAVAAFLLDGKIRTESNHQKSLDDVMRILYQRCAGKKGYSPKEFRDVCNEVAGTDLSDWFARSIDSTQELDYRDGLEAFGLSIPGYKSPEETPDTAARKRPWVGFSLDSDNKVVRVEHSSPATKAGINKDDEIIAVNDYRVSSFSAQLAQYSIGDRIKVLYARRGEIKTLDLEVGGKGSGFWRLRKSVRQSSKQKEAYKTWFSPKESTPKTKPEAAAKPKAGSASEPGDSKANVGGRTGKVEAAGERANGQASDGARDNVSEKDKQNKPPAKALPSKVKDKKTDGSQSPAIRGSGIRI